MILIKLLYWIITGWSIPKKLGCQLLLFMHQLESSCYPLSLGIFKVSGCLSCYAIAFPYSLPAFSFLILFLLFIITIEISERDQLNKAEIIFMIYALGFTLEKVAAMQEHGIKGFLIRPHVILGFELISIQFTLRAHGFVLLATVG